MSSQRGPIQGWGVHTQAQSQAAKDDPKGHCSTCGEPLGSDRVDDEQTECSGCERDSWVRECCL